MRLFNRIWSRTFAYVVLLGFTAFFVVPVIWLLLSPTKTDHELVVGNPFAIGTLHNLSHAIHVMFTFEDYALLNWLKNSAIYSFGGIVIALACSIPAGYGLAHTQFIGRRTLLGVTLFVMIMPATALVLPLFLEANAVHAVGTPWSVILPFSFFPFGVYLAYIFYSSSVPKDLLAAARIDGCNEWNVFRRVALPLARPIIAPVSYTHLLQASCRTSRQHHLRASSLYGDSQLHLLRVSRDVESGKTRSWNQREGNSWSASRPRRRSAARSPLSARVGIVRC